MYNIQKTCLCRMCTDLRNVVMSLGVLPEALLGKGEGPWSRKLKTV